jgi:hypothetical protein
MTNEFSSIAAAPPNYAELLLNCEELNKIYEQLFDSEKIASCIPNAEISYFYEY